jgi:prepilin-type N-terminal cleavage/methylation domain-containing protein
MSSPRTQRPSLRRNDGFTLIELLVAMLAGTVLTMAAFSFLIFTTEDVSHITARVGVDQTGRVALQNIASRLHDACEAPNITPIQEGSTGSVIKFLSNYGEQSSLPLKLHEIIYTPASGSKEGTLVEDVYERTGGTAPKYTWATTPTTTKLLTGVRQTQFGSETPTPVFQYFRYYQSSDSIPTGDTSIPYGELNKTAITEVKTAAEAEDITKVTVSFTVAPEGHEVASFNHDRPVPLENSVLFRLAPSSESPSNPNLPCTEKT